MRQTGLPADGQSAPLALSTQILFGRDRLKVIRIDAVGDAAEVVNFEPCGDFTPERLERNAVRLEVAANNVRSPISVPRAAAPAPAGSRVAAVLDYDALADICPDDLHSVSPRLSDRSEPDQIAVSIGALVGPIMDRLAIEQFDELRDTDADCSQHEAERGKSDDCRHRQKTSPEAHQCSPGGVSGDGVRANRGIRPHPLCNARGSAALVKFVSLSNDSKFLTWSSGTCMRSEFSACGSERVCRPILMLFSGLKPFPLSPSAKAIFTFATRSESGRISRSCCRPTPICERLDELIRLPTNFTSAGKPCLSRDARPIKQPAFRSGIASQLPQSP